MDRYKLADAEAAEGALELGEGVGVAGFAGFVAEEAKAVGVKVVGKAVGEEDVPDMGEVGEGGFGLDEARTDDKTGVRDSWRMISRLVSPGLNTQ